MIKIAIIDSGIDISSDNCEHVHIKNDVVISDDNGDYLGHGTAMYSIIEETINSNIEHKVLSVKVGNDSSVKNNQIDINDVIKAIEYSIQWGAKFINISMGVKIHKNIDDELKKINNICEYAYKNNIMLVSAIDPQGKITYPWCCNGVLKVSFLESRKKKIVITKNNVCGNEIRVMQTYIKGNKMFDKYCYYRSNSAAAAYVTGKLACCQSYKIENIIKEFEDDCVVKIMIPKDKMNGLWDGYKFQDGKFDVLKVDLSQFGSCALLPFNKEIESIIRYSEINISAVLDPIINGNYGKDPYNLLNMGISEIRIYSRLKDIKANTIIIGYIDKVEMYDEYYKIENLLLEALKYKMNVFSLLPVDKKYVRLFAENDLFLRFSPIINKKVLNKLQRISMYGDGCITPIIGIFGTSSKQGKLTLQKRLIKEIQNREINLVSLGTEHQAGLIGFDYCYPFGYGAQENIQLNIEEKMEFLARTLDYISYNDNADVIILGGQSRLLPYDFEKDSGIENSAFLEAVKPDCAVLVINPYIDNMAYIYDTIVYLENVYKCKVISLAYSDHVSKMIGKSVINKKISKNEMSLIEKKCEENFNKGSGCIMDEVYCQSLVDDIIDFFR